VIFVTYSSCTGCRGNRSARHWTFQVHYKNWVCANASHVWNTPRYNITDSINVLYMLLCLNVRCSCTLASTRPPMSLRLVCFFVIDVYHTKCLLLLLSLDRIVRRIMYVDEVCCYRPSSLVCRSVTLVVSPAKMAEPIEMPFGLRTWVPWNHVLDGGLYPTMGMGNFKGRE